MAIVEGDNNRKLMTQLADRNQDVDPKLLLAPKSRTRPERGLVASYGWRLQFAITDFALGKLVGQTTVVLGTWYSLYSLVSTLAPDNTEEIRNVILRVIAMAAGAERSVLNQLVIRCSSFNSCLPYSHSAWQVVHPSRPSGP